MGSDWTDSFTTAKEIVFLTPGRCGTDLFIEVFVELFDVLFQPLNMFFDKRSNRCRSGMKPIFLGSEHRDHLTATSTNGLQFLSGFIGNRAKFRTDFFAELRQDIAVDGIGFGQTARSASEISSLARIDCDRRQTCTQQASK